MEGFDGSWSLRRFIGIAIASILFFHGFGSSEKAPNYSFVHQATTAPSVSFHDYIIIGGGTAGCPLAATLSQNSSVLLLERGGSPYDNPNVTDIANFGAGLADTSPQSAAQQFISEDGVANARGRVLGGSSAINAGLYSHAEREIVLDSKWDGKLVNDSYKWVEKMVAFNRPLRQWQTAVKNGLLEAGVLPNNGFTFEHLTGTKIAASIFDEFGHRHTAADLLEYADPSRINVLLYATVHKILFRTKGLSRPKAYGVIFQDASGVKHTALLNRGSKNEIILSAGALGSPQLLMLSGVGPRQELNKFGIKVVLNQPLVGQHMADNPMNAIFVPSPIPVETALIQVVGITSFGSYVEPGCGVNLGVPPNYATLFGLPPTPPPPPGVNPIEQSPFMGGFFIEKVKGPLSMGYLKLKTLDPSDNPLVRFNYFKVPKDLETCIRGIETIQKVIESKAFSKFRYEALSVATLMDFTANKNITSVEQYCKETVRTMWHYHGGCQQGRVVDYDYKFLGIDALRVIDGSTFRVSPGTNPQATLMMLGRYMGVKIMNERLASN